MITQELVHKDNGRPIKKVTPQYTEGLIRIQQKLFENTSYLEKAIEFIFSDTLIKNTDGVLLAYDKILKLKEHKSDPDSKISQMRSITVAQKKGNIDFQKFKAKLVRLKTMHTVKLQELQLLRYLLGKIKHENQQLVIQHLQKYHSYYLNMFAKYNETTLGNEIKYLLHIISGREHDWVHSKIEGISEFTKEPIKYIKTIEIEAGEKHMSQDRKFLNKLRKMQEEARKLKPQLRTDYINTQSKLLEQIPNVQTPYQIIDIPKMAKTVLTFVQELKKSNPQISKFVRENDNIRHLLTYLLEIKDLLAHLAVIPDAKEYLSAGGKHLLPPEIRSLHSATVQRGWDDFIDFYHNLEKSKIKNQYNNKYGDNPTYQALLDTKRQFRMYPQKWSEVLASRIMVLYNPETATQAIIAARNSLMQFCNNQVQKINLELINLSKDVKIILQDKLAHLGKENETAYNDLKSRLIQRIKEITSPSSDQFKRLHQEASVLRNAQMQKWIEFREWFSMMMETIVPVTHTFAEFGAKMGDMVPSPTVVGNMIHNVIKDRDKNLNELMQIMGSVEHLASQERPKFDATQYASAFSARTNELANTGLTLDEIEKRSTQFTTGEGFDAFNRLYTLGYQTLKKQDEVIQALSHLGFESAKTQEKSTVNTVSNNQNTTERVLN